MKKGFTLVELLATIVILAIVSLITIPIITGVINKTRLNSLKSSAYGLLEASNLYMAQYETNKNIRFDIDNNNITSNDTNTMIKYKGTIKEGTVILNNKGKVTVCITDGKNSAYKNYNETKITLVEKNKCYIPDNTSIVYLDNGATITELSNQELTDRLLALEEENNTLKSEIRTLKTKVNTLEENNSDISTTLDTFATKSELQQVNTNLLSEIATVNTSINNKYTSLVNGLHTWTDVTSTAVTITNVSTNTIRVFTNGFECIIVGEYRTNTPQPLNGGWGSQLNNIVINNPYRPKINASLNGFDDSNNHAATNYILGTNGYISAYTGSSAVSISRIPIYGRWSI